MIRGVSGAPQCFLSRGRMEWASSLTRVGGRNVNRHRRKAVAWTHPPLAETPGDLRPALAGARLAGVEHDRSCRLVRIRFELPPETGIREAAFRVEEATHLLAFAYLPPVAGLAEGLSPEEAVARATEIAHQGLVANLDPNTPGLIVTHADLHTTQGAATLVLEGYGEDPDAVVWWRVEASGKAVDVRS